MLCLDPMQQLEEIVNSPMPGESLTSRVRSTGYDITGYSIGITGQSYGATYETATAGKRSMDTQELKSYMQDSEQWQGAGDVYAPTEAGYLQYTATGQYDAWNDETTYGYTYRFVPQDIYDNYVGDDQSKWQTIGYFEEGEQVDAEYDVMGQMSTSQYYQNYTDKTLKPWWKY